MRKERSLFVIGVWVAVLPFLGFPNSWRSIFFVITGIGLICLAYLFYNQSKQRILKTTTESKTFVDNIETKA
jgi:predicted MFS family arabinose efflux permease